MVRRLSPVLLDEGSCLHEPCQLFVKGVVLDLEEIALKLLNDVFSRFSVDDREGFKPLELAPDVEELATPIGHFVEFVSGIRVVLSHVWLVTALGLEVAHRLGYSLVTSPSL